MLTRQTCRRIVRLCSGLALTVFLVGWAQAEAPPSPPELAATVSLEREDLKAGDTVAAEVWLSNPSDVEIQAVEAQLARPYFIDLVSFSPPANEKCGTGPDKTSLPLGALPPHSVRSGRICLAVGQSLREGDYNLLFVFRYRSAVGGVRSVSFVAVEKKIRVGLLGTESVGGFSLRLVALILPGLLFWMVLQLSQLGGNFRSAFDKGALAVLTSILLLAFTSAYLPRALAAGMSVPGLLTLCAVGTGLGLAVALLIHLLRYGTRKSIQKRVVQRDDFAEEAFRKLLVFPGEDLFGRLLALLGQGFFSKLAGIPDKRVLRNPTIKLKEGQELTGCLLGPAAKGLVLVGTYQLKVADKNLYQELSGLQNQQQWSKLLERADQEKLSLQPDVPVRVKDAQAGAAWADSGPMRPVEEDKIDDRSSRRGPWVPIHVVP